MKRYETDDPLAVLFYLLARDAVPAGELVRCVNMTREHKSFQLTNPHLAAFAVDLAFRIRSDALRCEGQLGLPDPAENQFPTL